MPSTYTFVLVHGAWHGAWCWRRVISILRSAGHTVFAPTLTGFGERVHLIRPDLTIEDFATDIVNVITAEELNDIILVGHSFGGNPISVVADRAPERLKQLVYIDTVLLQNGESAFSRLDPSIVAQRIELAEKSSGGLTIPPPSPEAFGVTDAADAEWLRRQLTPLPLNCYRAPIHLKHPLGNGVNKTYIACTNPVYHPAVPTHEWVKMQTDWHYVEISTGHDAMVTSPEGLSETLIRCA
ncbi:MAG: alpha/beta hydrolase [Verrucomicrobia bacterium]|nr:alpha/beta hydrolase [Verrucomicrobiota bacterium]MBV8275333.1 alpha/beta hydrolase [Verrucomicrobiota bacterium]